MTDQQRIAEIRAECNEMKADGAKGYMIHTAQVDFLLSQLAAKDTEIERLREAQRTLYAEFCNLLEAQRWIPVSERLPEEGQRVLVWNCASNPSHVATFTSGGRPENMWHYNDGYDDPACWVDGVTHWMPLPSAEGLHDEV